MANLFDAFRANSEGTSSYSAWISMQIWKLLQKPAVIREEAGGVRVCSVSMPLHVALTSAFDRCHAWRHSVRVELLDGRVIREWRPW